MKAKSPPKNIEPAEIEPAAPATQRPTILDVALKSGLSKATVSKALNIPPELTTLRPETRERAIQAAKELGYRPNWLARSFATRKTQTIGLLYSRPLPPVSDIYAELVRHTISALKAHNYELLFVQYSETSDQWRQILADHRLDGCLVLEHLSDELCAALEEHRMPAVLLNAESDGPFPKLLFDDAGGVAKLARHLIELGHRRVAYYHGSYVDTHFSARHREEVIVRRLQAAGDGWEAHAIVSSPNDLAAAVQSGTEPATAIVAFHHRLALELLRALWERNIHAPRDISVATFNDVHGTQNSIPPLTTLSFPMKEMASSAVEFLMQRITAPDAGDFRQVLLPETLVIRSSTGRCAP